MTDLIENQSVNNQVMPSFFGRKQVEFCTLPIGRGVPLGIEKVFNAETGIGGAYGAWGEAYNNDELPKFLEDRLGLPLKEDQLLDLAPLGFLYRHHIANLSPEEHYQVEMEVGSRFLSAAIEACGWKPEEVEGVLIGTSAPVAVDYTEQISRMAGIPENAIKVSIHKACDGGVSAMHLVLNPDLYENQVIGKNLAKELFGKKVLVGGIEGLSRFISGSRDLNALQLFGNGAGIIGVIPGKTLKFLVGKAHEVFDEKGLLAVRMFYPHSLPKAGKTNIDVIREGMRHIRVAGLMHEPDGGIPIEMAGLMGMVKLFVRSGVEVVSEVYKMYQNLLSEMGNLEKSIKVTIAHHANFKINKLKVAQLEKDGIILNVPWVLSEFGNVSAASAMIAFLRQLGNLAPGDHILVDGFGAGTYYDVIAAMVGEAA